MRKITAIEAQKKNPKRVNVYLDDEFAFGLSRITAAWLQVGQTISEEKIKDLQAEDTREIALQRALHFLSYRSRSIEEVRKNLNKHAIPEQIIEDTVERLENNGLLGDKQFAEAWVENRNTFRPRSHRALALELRYKGISDEIIQSVLEETDDEDSLAYKAGIKRARRLSGLERQDFNQKLGGYLARRGFSYSVIKPVIGVIWNEIRSDAETDSEDEELK